MTFANEKGVAAMQSNAGQAKLAGLAGGAGLTGKQVDFVTAMSSQGAMGVVMLKHNTKLLAVFAALGNQLLLSTDFEPATKGGTAGATAATGGAAAGSAATDSGSAGGGDGSEGAGSGGGGAGAAAGSATASAVRPRYRC